MIEYLNFNSLIVSLQIAMLLLTAHARITQRDLIFELVPFYLLDYKIKLYF